tara:strand:- start:44 stop:1372 length:1329 start_codon:yes stop_codon:yes gene_type:complete
LNLTDSTTSVLCYTQGDYDDIAFNPINNKLYGTSGWGLVEIDLLTGNVTSAGINSWPTSNFNALTFDSNGDLYAMTGISDVLYKIDVINQSIVSLGSCGTGYASAGDLTFYQGELYLTGHEQGNMSNTRLIKIDYNNPANSIILGYSPAFYGITTAGCQEEFYAVTSSNLYKFDITGTSPSYQFVLNPNFGSLVLGATTIPQLPFSNLGIDQLLCYNGQQMLLNPILSNSVDNYLWSNGSSDSQIIINEPGEYWVQTTAVTCNGDSTVSDTINVTLISPPFFSLKNDTIICIGEEITLDATTTNATYLWQNYSKNSFFNVTNSGEYIVEVTVDSCITTYSINVLIENCDEVKLVIPNVFTPNNDGFNELFTPTISKNIIFMNTSIYNRWGQLIFDSNFLNIGWNGKTTTGDEVPEGTYYWVINYSDINGNKEKIKGYLTLLR